MSEIPVYMPEICIIFAWYMPRYLDSPETSLIFLQHPYNSTGADYKSKGRLALGKLKDDYWVECEPMRNEAKVAGNLAQLDCTVQSVYTYSGDCQAGMSTRAYALQSVTVR